MNAVVEKEAPREAVTGKVDEDAATGYFLDGKKHLVVVITTDRGLCGSVNSAIARLMRKELNASIKAGADLKMFVLGDKGRAQIARDYMPVMTRTIDNYLGASPAAAAGRRAAVRRGPSPPPCAPTTGGSFAPTPSNPPFFTPLRSAPLPADHRHQSASPSSPWPRRSRPRSCRTRTTC